jgi:effector-binding domain-containing protein/predicted transcriptional regulator with HTH domain
MTKRNKILYSLGALVLLFLLAGFLIPGVIQIEKEACTDIPKPYLYNIINDLSTYRSWNQSHFEISSDQSAVQNPLKGVNSVLEITSDDSMSGIVKIISASTDSIVYETTVEGKKQSEKSIFRITERDGMTCIHAVVEIRRPFPSNITGFIAAIGHRKSLKKSLQQLTDTAEKRYREGIYRGYKINEEAQEARYFIINRSEVKIENTKQFYTQNISALYQALLDAGINSSGMPCGLFFKWDEQKEIADMAAAIPVLSELYIRDTGSFQIPARRVLVIEYFGDSANSGVAHFAMNDYMADRGLLQDVPVIEEYVTDPSKEPDPAKWLTRIIYLPAE